MPRVARHAPGGLIYHVRNRSVGRMHLFRKDDDFAAFERVLLEAHQRTPVRCRVVPPPLTAAAP